MILFGKEFSLGRCCAGCKAKETTIALLADVVDWHRAQAGLPLPITQALPQSRPEPSLDGPLWVSEEEEDIVAALEHGQIPEDQAERALAALQALTQTAQVVR